MTYIQGEHEVCNEELLISIPEDQKKKKKNGAKNADLIGDLPVEKALVFNGISLINLSLSTFR